MSLCDLELIRNGTGANALVFDIVDDVLDFLLINIHRLVT